MEIELKKVGEMQVAYIAHVGPYGEVGPLFAEIAGWLAGKGLQISGPPFGIYYDNPEVVPAEKLRCEVGFPFIGETQGEGRIKVKKIPGREVLSGIHKGPYREVGPVYEALTRHAVKKGYSIVGAPVEIYLNAPGEVPESELLTEVQIPVTKE